MEMLQLNDLHKTFNPGTVNEKVALNGVSLHMEAGDFATIVGSNGAGKSTTFNMICGYYPPTEGRIFYKGEDITDKKAFEENQHGGYRETQINGTLRAAGGVLRRRVGNSDNREYQDKGEYP